MQPKTLLQHPFITPDRLMPDTRGMNFYQADPSLRDVLGLYLPQPLFAHLQPHLSRMGELAGGRLDELAQQANQHPPVLEPRTRRGEDRQRIAYHPAYHEMERIAFGEFALGAMSHRGGALDWPEPLPPNAKYALTYLFTQAEFGLCCPINMTDSLARVLSRVGPEALRREFLPGLLSGDLDELLQGTMFMTEQGAGSDVGRITTQARREGGAWRLYGEKWFCSNTDADLALVLARPEGAPEGTRGLGLFLVPRRLPDGSPNAYTIIRLKDKFGSRSMASGEIRFEGALAHVVGELERGFVQMADMINMSRLSNGVRAAGLMRRACHEALHVARNRHAFGSLLLRLPLMRRQLLKMLLPTEQALSMVMFTGSVLEASDREEAGAWPLLRILTPLLKLRATREARKVASDAMEARGGVGYIEEWINPRLVRDTHLGSIWEGTSNIVALDVMRAIRREGSLEPLAAAVHDRLGQAEALPGPFRERLEALYQKAAAQAARCAEQKDAEVFVRQAATGLYNAVSAVLLAWEGSRLARTGNDARRLLLAALVAERRLEPADPLAPGDPAREDTIAALLLEQDTAPLEAVLPLLG